MLFIAGWRSWNNLFGQIMKKHKPFEAQITTLSLYASIPILLLLLWVMVYAHIATPLILLTILISTITIAYCHLTIRQKVNYQFRSLSNLLEAMTQGDYTLRANTIGQETASNAFNDLASVINGLANTLSKQRMESIESQKLLRMVISHIDVAIIALDDQYKIGLINPSAEKLLHYAHSTPIEQRRTLPVNLQELVKAQSLSHSKNHVMELNFGHHQGKFNVHIEGYLEGGKQHKLLFITDVSSILRSEERNAWKSLVRVISHEINNSLTPITSIAQTLQKAIERQQDIETTKSTLQEGLTVISERSNSLKDFVNSYKQIAQLPKPQKINTSILDLIEKSSALFTSLLIHYPKDNDTTLNIDPVQIEQVLINIIKNAIEATEPVNPQGQIDIDWEIEGSTCRLTITDEGTGLSNLENIFVPFYTTKNQGSGIGLVLCRQILEAHDGHLSLLNREDKQGCIAVIELKTQ